jgi:hypothetical protein
MTTTQMIDIAYKRFKLETRLGNKTIKIYKGIPKLSIEP